MHNVSSFFCKCIWSLLFGIYFFFLSSSIYLFFTLAKLKSRAHVHRLCLGSSWQRWILEPRPADASF